MSITALWSGTDNSFRGVTLQRASVKIYFISIHPVVICTSSVEAVERLG